MKIASAGTALPPHTYPQSAIRDLLRTVWRDHPVELARLDSLWGNVAIEQRALAQPIERYTTPQTFGELNDIWIDVATELGERAVTEALERADLTPDDVDALFFTTVTGVASPSIDARVVNALGLPSHVVRVPMFGLGCVGGAAGVARAADHVRAHPSATAVVLAIELCSLTFQRSDLSTAHLVATSLFGDGAAAAVITGRESAQGPEVVDTRSVFYPDTQDLMGWRISEQGFRLVLSPGVPDIARERVGADADDFLTAHGLTRADIQRWICHPGGPKVLRALADALDLPEDRLAASWESLRRVGNLSSASVLFVLEQALGQPPEAGSHGVMTAMGPGFCAELVLLRW